MKEEKKAVVELCKKCGNIGLKNVEPRGLKKKKFHQKN